MVPDNYLSHSGTFGIKQCEATKADQNLNLNHAKETDVDGEKDMKKDIEEKEQNCHLGQKLFRMKHKVEKHIILY